MSPATIEERPLRLEREGLLQCAICGEFRRSVGIHIRVHGITADEYRERFGLNKKRGLVGPDSYERYRAAAVDSDRASVLQAGSDIENLIAKRPKRLGPMALETRLRLSLQAQKETCAQGHPWSVENTLYSRTPAGRWRPSHPRHCRTCQHRYQRKARRKQREAGRARPWGARKVELNRQQEFVLELRAQGQTLHSIGERLKVTGGRVHQIETVAKERLAEQARRANHVPES